jgi:hypothetical protein
MPAMSAIPDQFRERAIRVTHAADVSAMVGAHVSLGGEGLGEGVKRDHIRRMDIPHSSYCYS